MDNVNKIQEKIAALLQKTIGNGASEAEANAAMLHAQKLMEQHGVTLDDIKNHTGKSDFITRQVNVGDKNVDIVDKLIITSIAKYTDTHAWLHMTGNHETKIMFIGYSVDVELATYIRKVCKCAVDAEWKLFSAGLPIGNRAIYRKTFVSTMCVRLALRLRDLKEENIVKTSGTELVVLKQALVLQEFEILKDGRKSAKVGLGTVHTDVNVAAAGRAAGDKVKFHREVNSGPKRIEK